MYSYNQNMFFCNFVYYRFYGIFNKNITILKTLSPLSSFNSYESKIKFIALFQVRICIAYDNLSQILKYTLYNPKCSQKVRKMMKIFRVRMCTYFIKKRTMASFLS